MSQDITIVEAAVLEARGAAAAATREFLEQHGDGLPCGFAWVKTYVKGNTRLGRALMREGFRRAYGGGLEMWNPSGNPTQNIDAKEIGAHAAARVLTQRLGVEFYTGSRLD